MSTNLADRLYQPCPLCNADATTPPGSTWPCGQCDGLRFVPTDCRRTEIHVLCEWTLRIVADLADAADDLDEIAKDLRPPLTLDEIPFRTIEARTMVKSVARRLRALIHACDGRTSAGKVGGR